MSRQYQVWLGLGTFLGLLVSGMLLLSVTVEAQQTSLNETIRAVVRIRGCNVAGCNVGLGSGVVIHSSGIILTANHVTLTDKNNPLSARLEDFVVELTESVQQSPHARYRARLLAAKPEADMALLGIYWDETTNRPLDETLTVNLPALAAADASTILIGEQLHILGYPLAGGSAINYTGAAMGGFDENGALIKVSASLSPGNSGGPALVERNGRYEIAGIVISGRGDRLEVGVIRSIDQLHTLTWEPTAQRVWPENIQVIAHGQGAGALLQIRMDIHAFDYISRNGRLLAYLFDAQTRQPWTAGDDALPRNASGQIVLHQNFSASRMVDALPDITLTIPFDALGAQPDQLMLRLLLWDADASRALWRDEEWRHPQPGAVQVALVPIATSTDTPLPTNTPTPTVTPSPSNTPSPLVIHTPRPTPTVSTQGAIESPTLTPTTPPLVITASQTQLLEPLETILQGRRTFRWTTDISLGENQAYELVFWRAGGTPMRNGFGPVGMSTATEVIVNLDAAVEILEQLIPGEDYEWGVLLVQAQPYQRIQFLGASHHFRLEQEQSGGDSDSGSPRPTNTPRG